MTFGRGTQAYQAAAGHRSTREQEADVFRRATGALRSSLEGTETDLVRAISDNRQLWMTVSNLMKDPANPLPQELKAGIISVGLSLSREMDSKCPDVAFLINVNENMVAGLAGET